MESVERGVGQPLRKLTDGPERRAKTITPGSINCYLVEVQELGAAAGGEGKKFKLDPARLVYSLHWQHKAEPPDFDLVLVQDGPAGWVNIANLTLLGELRRRAPEAVGWGVRPNRCDFHVELFKPPFRGRGDRADE
jgi:hypothetical protein